MLVVLEGLDGVGKSVQGELLQQYFKGDAQLHHYPQHHIEPFGELISQLLAGNLGSLEQTSPYLIALLFAADQFTTARNLMQVTDITIFDRYFYSNIAYQGARLASEEREQFRRWLLNVVENCFALPKPDIVFYLQLPESVMQANLAKRKGCMNLDKYEANRAYQQLVKAEYEVLCSQYDNFIPIMCADENEQWRSVQAIHEELVKHITARQ